MALQNSINAPTPLSTANGGTGNTATLANGQLWIGNGTVTPSISTITPGAGISVTNAAGDIIISNTLQYPNATLIPSSATVFTFSNTTANFVVIFGNTSGGITFTLPASGTIGQSIQIISFGPNGWIINSFSQTINVGGVQTTAVTGSVSSKNPYDSIILYCVASTSWIGVPLSGTLNIV